MGRKETLISLTDVVHRRTRGMLKEDLVKMIYVTYASETKSILTIIIGAHLDSGTLTSMAVRYNHLFSDMTESVDVHIIDQPNHFKPGENTYQIYNFDTGFVLVGNFKE